MIIGILLAISVPLYLNQCASAQDNAATTEQAYFTQTGTLGNSAAAPDLRLSGSRCRATADYVQCHSLCIRSCERVRHRLNITGSSGATVQELFARNPVRQQRVSRSLTGDELSDFHQVMMADRR